MSLVAIISMTVLAVLFDGSVGYHLQTVQDFAGMTHEVIFPYALLAGLVGLTEAVLTLRVIDEMTEIKGDTDPEILAQGLGNLPNGLLGGVGGDSMIGQSIINIKSGGRTRMSSLVAPLFLLFFIMFGTSVINLIPLADLVGVMFRLVVGTFEWESLKYNGKIPRQDIIVMLAVTFVTIFSDLATAVIVGVLFSTPAFAWKKGAESDIQVVYDFEGKITYKLH